jgi:hypothetical protein
MAPSKVSLFLWQLYTNRLLTIDNLFIRGILQPDQRLCSVVMLMKHTFASLNMVSLNRCGVVLVWLDLHSALPNNVHFHVFSFVGYKFVICNIGIISGHLVAYNLDIVEDTK